MKRFLKENENFASFVIIGLVFMLVLCGIRAVMEFRDTDVCVIMSAEDVTLIDGELDGVRAFDGGNVLDGVLLLVEDENQYSYNPIEGDYLPDALARTSSSVRCAASICIPSSRRGTITWATPARRSSKTSSTGR